MSALREKNYRGFVESRKELNSETVNVNGKSFIGHWVEENFRFIGPGIQNYIVEETTFEDGMTTSGQFTGNAVVEGTLCVYTRKHDKFGQRIYSNDILKVNVKDESCPVRFVRVEWTEESGFVQYDMDNGNVSDYYYCQSELVGTIFDDFETIKKNSTIKIGDMVKVINPICYQRYVDWVLHHANKYSVYFAYDHNDLSNINTMRDERFKVVAIAPHRDPQRRNETLCLIQARDFSCYLISMKGIRVDDSARPF